MPYIFCAPTSAPAVLVLGGTSESRTLTAALLEHFGEQLHIAIALASNIVQPQFFILRCGPFSGVESLIAYLLNESIAAVIVATHPFASTIAHNARLACEICKVPRLTLDRLPWIQTADDHWVEVKDVTAAARCLPNLGRRAFLTIGTRQLSAFAASHEMWFLVRLRREMPLPFLPHEPPHCLITSSGENDLVLMRNYAIDVLVTKASGGDATAGKIAAARVLGIPVLMLRRPPVEPGETVTTVVAAVSWVETTVVI